MGKILWTRRKTMLAILCIFSATTIVLQIPPLLNKYGDINYVIWPVLGIITLIVNKLKLRVNGVGLSFFVIWCGLLMYCCVCYVAMGTHINSNYLKNLLLPLCLYWIGIQVSTKLQPEDTGIIAKCYISAALVLGIYIFANTFTSISSWMNAVKYLYGSKNSAAQILTCAIIMCDYMHRKKKNILYLVVMGFLFILICLMQCRTAILGLSVIVFIRIITSKRKKWIKFALVIGVCVALGSIDTVRVFLQKVFSLYGSRTEDLDAFSSGRIGLYINSFNVFSDNIVFGCGKWYVDNMYLSIFTELGVVGATPVICFLIWFVISNYLQDKNQNSELNYLLFNMAIYFFITSFFEGYAPFGPGSCSFILWLLNGFRDGMKCEIINKRRRLL